MMDSTSITNYDVLVEPPISGQTGDYRLDKHKSHVGNNRLEVFLNLYQQAYSGARQRGDFNECNSIVDKIVGTVCHQCVPRGRFLVSSTTDNGQLLWNQLDEDRAKVLLHKVLQPAQSVSNQGEASKNDEGQKRRRRSSLLRRSASESMIGMVVGVESKKKLTRIVQCREEPTWKSTSSHRVLSPNRMDVILTPDREALDPNSQSVGNNRLHILVAMQSAKYQQATVDGKEDVLGEVVQTVNMFWKGRFLVEGSDGHEELSKEEARSALRSIFDMRSGQSFPSKRHSLPIAQIPPPSAAGLQRQVSAPVLPLRTGLAKQFSAPVLPTRPPEINLPGVSDLRSAAVRSLQKQKQRQTIASRLEKIARQNAPNSNPAAIARNPFHGTPFTAMAAARAAQKRESTVLGKLDASVIEQLVADFDDADCNDNDDPEPLPPTNSNKFGNQFSGGRDSFIDNSQPFHHG